MQLHPPAMGGKTAWGVSELASRPSDDPQELLKIKRAQSDFDAREEDRLKRLKAMDAQASDILEARRARKASFEMGVSTNADHFKQKQLDILKKMQETKAEKKAAKKLQRDEQGLPPKKARGRTKKTKKTRSSSSSESSSSGSSSSSSSSSSPAKKGRKGGKKKRDKDKGLRQELAQVQRLATEAEAKRKTDEARAKEKEAKRKAKAELAQWEAEMKRKEAEAEAKRETEAKQRAEEAEAKRKAELKAKAAVEDKKVDAAEAKRKEAEAEARKQLFQTDSLRKKNEAKKKADTFSGLVGRDSCAGGYKERDHVVANQNITIRGNLVVMAGTAGTIVGPAETDPIGRVAVDFVRRQDGGAGCLNVVPKEIRRG